MKRRKNNEERKSYSLHIRVTNQDREALSKMCEKSGCPTVSALIREQFIAPFKRVDDISCNPQESDCCDVDFPAELA